jgi:hypothetical protein
LLLPHKFITVSKRDDISAKAFHLDDKASGMYCISQVAMLKNAGLPYKIVGSIVQVFRSERRRINGRITGIGCADTMLLN